MAFHKNTSKSYLSSDLDQKGPFECQSDHLNFSVKLLGSSGVGKTSLCEKFLYPDYVYTYDSGAGLQEPSVCIMLEDVETELIFLDGSKEKF